MSTDKDGTILVLMPTWVGDICMATPAMAALRAVNPDAKIIASVRPGLSCLLEGHGAVSGVIEVDPGGLLGPFRVGRQFRSLQPDTVILLPNSFRSALTARRSGAPTRVGYRRDGRSWLLTDAVDRLDSNAPVSAVESYMHLITRDDTPAGPMHLEVTDNECTQASALLGDGVDPYVVLVPGANRTDKRWPAERFASLADRLHTEHGWRILLSGAPGERDVTGAVASAMSSPSLDLAAQGASLGALKAIIAAAELVISNDTGPRHIAAALGTPVVSILGPTDQRWAVSEHAGETRLLACPFLPEELVADDHAALCGIDRISVEDVVHAANARHAGA